jgi:hypothetical protein
MADLLLNCTCPPEKAGGQQQLEMKIALKMFNFGINIWPRLTQEKLLKRGIEGLFDVEISILGSKIP